MRIPLCLLLTVTLSLAGADAPNRPAANPLTLGEAYRRMLNEIAVPVDGAHVARAALKSLNAASIDRVTDDREANSRLLDAAASSLPLPAVWPAFEALADATNDPHTWAVVERTIPNGRAFFSGQPSIGTGMYVHRLSSGEIVVNHILESSPAAAAGLKLGDAIAELDGTPVVTGRQIFKLNTKSAGEVVPMSVRRIGETSSRRVELTLGSRPPTYFEARVVDRVGIISCESFPSASAGDPLAPWLDALSKFDEAKVAGLVFDLRWNRGGGGIPRLASLFVPAETLWYSSRAGKITPIRREGSTREVQSPIVVVVDEETGSGAEYLAFCLQQHRRAKIVGQPTAGALTGVTTLPVAGGILRFPVSVICDEHGASPAGFRVAPDVVVPNRSREDLSTRGDPQLEKAIQLIHATKPADRTGRVETGNGISLECHDSADTRLGMAEKGSGRGS